MAFVMRGAVKEAAAGERLRRPKILAKAAWPYSSANTVGRVTSMTPKKSHMILQIVHVSSRMKPVRKFSRATALTCT